jgi:STE24 endopeptidase
LAFAERVQFPLNDVSVIDGSKRSSKANAFFTGFGKTKRIALFDTLVNSQSVDEVLAVLAHEVGHYKKGHVVRGMIFGLLQMGALLFALGLLLQHQGLYDAFGVPGRPLYIGIVLFGLLIAPLELVLSLVLNRQSRRHEFEADAFATQSTGNGEALVSGLKKLSVNHLANLTPHPLTVALSYSHPPVLQRIQAIRRLAN